VTRREPDAEADLIGDRIRQVRESLELGRLEFAGRLSVHPGSVARWESGGSIPQPFYLRRIAELGGVSVGWLRYGAEDASAAGPRREPAAAAARAGAAGPLITEELVTQFLASLGEPGAHGRRKLDALAAYRALITLHEPVPGWWYTLQERVEAGEL
jgi:transcriptional regulator with XRE-family HTH domain